MGVAGRGEGEGVQRQVSWDQSEARPERDRTPVPVLDGISKIESHLLRWVLLPNVFFSVVAA